MEIPTLVPGTREWARVRNAGAHHAAITEETKVTTAQEAKRFRGSVRVAKVMFKTDSAHEKFRKADLATPMP